MNNSIPAWLPNWEEEIEYPDPITTTPQEWAWQFLRRNEEYQSEYNKLHSSVAYFSYKKEEATTSGKWRTKNGNITQRRRPVITNPQSQKMVSEIRSKFGLNAYPINPAEHTPKNVQRIFHSADAVIHLEAELEWFKEKKCEDEKEHLPMMREPLDSDFFYPENEHYIYDYLKHKFKQKKLERLEVDAIPAELLFSINLEGNIRDQLKRIELLVVRMQTELKNQGYTKYRNFMPEIYHRYLRTHDARISGKTNKKIAEKLLPIDFKRDEDAAEDRIKKGIKSIEELINSGYKEIAKIFPKNNSPDSV